MLSQLSQSFLVATRLDAWDSRNHISAASAPDVPPAQEAKRPALALTRRLRAFVSSASPATVRPCQP